MILEEIGGATDDETIMVTIRTKSEATEQVQREATGELYTE